ncbi:hypothetical protein EIP91_012087 [Steccherinum ochraceum]|uniref:Uncharacterized protein n=1 Tax=Steccherinum ochraceum TaxID=92696 RepID=A0A4R0RY54_9APHY|nr:hypothetical protein EIP91_012087 [Steccherinum ochraceum]
MNDLRCDTSTSREVSSTKNAASIADPGSPGPFVSFPRVGSEKDDERCPPRVLRSSRGRKFRSVSDAAVEIHKAHERKQASNVPRLRRTKRSVSWPMAGKAEEDDLALQRASRDSWSSFEGEEDQTPQYTEGSHSTYVTAPTFRTQEEQPSGYSQYATARTTFDCTLDSIDEDSVVHFFNPPQSFAYSDYQTGPDSNADSGYDNYDTAQSSPSAVSGTGPVFTYRLNTPRLPIPSLMLTFPTPTIPPSPVFLSQSPITLQKYAAASSTPVAPPRTFSNDHTLAVPSLPRCDCCGLAEFEKGTQCAECDHQWLACKVWYQANDGGRRRYLTEPYVKAAESNARTRAILDVLGVPGGSPGPLGLGIEFETHTPRKRRFWRFSRFLASVPMSVHPVADQSGDIDQDSGSGSHSTLLAKILGKTSARLGRLRMKITALLGSVEDDSVTQDMVEVTESSVSFGSSHQLVPPFHNFGTAQESLEDPVALPGRLACPESRFVEHLAGHFGSLMVRI